MDQMMVSGSELLILLEFWEHGGEVWGGWGGTYCVQVMTGSGKPSASHASTAAAPTLAVALTSACRTRTLGKTEKQSRGEDGSSRKSPLC